MYLQEGKVAATLTYGGGEEVSRSRQIGLRYVQFPVLQSGLVSLDMKMLLTKSATLLAFLLP